MFKKYLPGFLFLLAALAATSQTPVPDQPDSKTDTVYRKILLIPYNPIMHLSDADQDIAEYSQKKAAVVRAVFRRSLLQSVNTRLFTLCETQPLLPESAEKDLEMIYGSLNYGMDTVFPVLYPPIDSLQKKKSIFAKKQPGKAKEIHDLKYMNLRLSHPEILAMLSAKYGNDLFVFLNQLEIKTNYDDCLDLALKVYRRELKVHYSVFDPSGKQVYGDVAVVDYPSSSNDVGEIMRGNFPKIAEYVLHSIPKKK